MLAAVLVKVGVAVFVGVGDGGGGSSISITSHSNLDDAPRILLVTRYPKSGKSTAGKPVIIGVRVYVTWLK